MEVEEATGVPQKTIQRLLREGRLEVAEGSRVYLYCDVCHKQIRSGRFCPECETKMHRSMEAKQREVSRQNNVQGFSSNQKTSDDGHRRFVRDDG